MDREHVEAVRDFIHSFKGRQEELIQIKEAFIQFINDCVEEVTAK